MEFPLIVLSPPARPPAPFSLRICTDSFTFLHPSVVLFPPLVRTHLAGVAVRGRRILLRAGVASDATAAVSVALRDSGAAVLVTAGAYSLVLTFDSLTKRNIIEQCMESSDHISTIDFILSLQLCVKYWENQLQPDAILMYTAFSEQSLSRKVVHVLSGLLYMVSWPIFSSSLEARYFATVVPLLNCIRLLIYGLSIVTDESLIKSVTREGKPEELLRGPLYYVLVLMFSTLAFWRESPIGIISLAMMSGGDGFADIMGRRYGSLKLPFNSKKSWIGSISMFMFGFLSSIMMLYYFSAFGYLHLDWGKAVEKVVIVSLAAAVVESLPVTEVIDDNIIVPVISMLVAFLAFGYGAHC